MLNPISRTLHNSELELIKAQGYKLRDNLILMTSGNPDLQETIKTIFKGSGVTDAMAHVFYGRKSWAELKVHSDKTEPKVTAPSVYPTTSFAYSGEDDISVFSNNLSAFIKSKANVVDSQMIGLGYAINMLPTHRTRTPKTDESKKLVCKLNAGSPLRMSRPFNVQILKNGTELKAKVLYFIDRPDCSGQDMMAIVSGSLEVISHESIIGGEAIKSELDKFDELTDTITGEEANRLYNSGRRITAFTLSSLNTNNEKQLVSIEINPNGKSLNDNLTEISLKHDAFGFKFTK